MEITTLCPVGGEWELVSDTDEATVAEVVEAAEEPAPKPKRKRTVKK